MVNPLRLGYIEAAQSALTLSLKLARIARNEATPHDVDVVKRAAEDLSKFLTPDAGKLEFPLFASPQGCRATIQISKREPWRREGDDPLNAISQILKGLLNAYSSCRPSSDLQQQADKLSQFFDAVQHYAEGLAARIPRRASREAPREAIGLLR